MSPSEEHEEEPSKEPDFFPMRNFSERNKKKLKRILLTPQLLHELSLYPRVALGTKARQEGAVTVPGLRGLLFQ